MGYQINFGNSAFAVPGAVADHYIRLANATQLRVLLYLLRYPEAELPEAAAFLKIDEEQAEEAIQFWMQVNVLEGSDSILTVPMIPEVTPSVPESPAPVSSASVQASAAVQRSSKDVKLDPSEIADMLEHSQELTDLFALAEKMLGEPLKHMEQRSLVWMHSYLNIRSEVILTLLGYCISIERYNMRYVETIAISWEAEGIVTLELAEAEIQRLKAEHSYIGQLCRMFEMKRRPTTRQKAYMDAWRAAGYSMELLNCAYEITVENIEKLDFKYMNTILESWAAHGVATPEQALQLRGKGASKGRKKSALTSKELEEMDAYLSLVNRFEEDDDT